MDQKKRNSGSPVIFFTAAIIIILAVMFVADRLSGLKQEISFPTNNGVSKLSSHDGYLVAACHDNRVFIWDWNDLYANPRQCVTDSDQAVLYDANTLVSMNRVKPASVSLFNVADGKKVKSVFLPQSTGGYLLATSDRSTIAALLSDPIESPVKRDRYRLYLIDFQSQLSQPVVTVEMPDDTSRILDAAISPDGSFAVAVGEKGKHGWLLGIDITAKSAAWNHEVDDFQQITKVAFSADGLTVYARGSDSTLSIINRAAGGISDHWQPEKGNPSQYRQQAPQDVDVSTDGRAVAGVIGTTVYIWDGSSGKKLYEGASEHKLVSSVTFSSDSNYIATADGRQGGKIRVIEVPDK